MTSTQFLAFLARRMIRLANAVGFDSTAIEIRDKMDEWQRDKRTRL